MKPTARRLKDFAPFAYGLLLAGIVALVVTALYRSKAYLGWYARPAFFRSIRFLDFLQLGLLPASLVALALHWSRRRGPLLRTVTSLPGILFALWLALWALVHANFGIRLSLAQVWDHLTIPHSLELVGLVRGQLFFTLAVLVLFAVGLAAAIQAAASRTSAPVTRRVVLVLVGMLIASNFVVRGYFAWHLARNQRAVLMLEEGVPLNLTTERLIPGVARRRIQLPSFKDPARTSAYLSWAGRIAAPPIPRKFNILWISVESLRFDALSESTAPYLFARQAEFQLRLSKDHWSGANATKSGIFAMMSGLAAYHEQEFRSVKLTFPLLTLLAQNGYRLRVGKALSFYYGAMRDLLPSQVIMGETHAATLPAGDRDMVDSLLLDLGRRDSAQPAFDLLTFDATHWPYSEEPGRYPPAYKALRAPEAVRLARIRYDTVVRSVDEEIGRVLERLRTTGLLNRTVVLITGDHGEEFLERGQLGHSSGMNDYQGRIPLWVRFPEPVSLPEVSGLTSSLDLVPTLLDYLGFDRDVLRTQGRSLLRVEPPRSLLMVAEQGWTVPAFHSLVSPTYLSRWRESGKRFVFSSVERRDGTPVQGLEWLHEVEAERAQAALGYEELPDPSLPAPLFGDTPGRTRVPPVVTKVVGQRPKA